MHRRKAHKLGQDNISGRIFNQAFEIHNPVFLISAGSVALFVILALAMPNTASTAFGWLRTTLTSNFDWLFIVAADAFVLFCICIAVSPWGKVRIGGPEAKPRLQLSRLVRTLVCRRRWHRPDVFRCPRTRFSHGSLAPTWHCASHR